MIGCGDDVFGEDYAFDDNVSSYIVRDLDSGMAYDMRADEDCIASIHS